MHVLAVTPGAELYGSDRVFLESVRGFLAAGHEVTVATGAAGPLAQAAASAGAAVEVVPMPVLRRSYASATGIVRFAGEVARALPRLIRLARRSGADISYVNTATLPVWGAVVRGLGLPLVVHVHEAESGDSRLVRTALSAPLVGANRIVFNSRTSRDLARRDLGPALRGVDVVPNAVDFTAAATPARAVLSGPVRLVYVGRLSERKGVDVALDAVALLVARGINAHLDVVGEVFAGNEPFGEALRRRAADPDLDGRVTFHGFQADPSALVAAADIVLVPSRGPESFGNVLVEAVGAGRPTVAAAQTGLIEAGHGLRSVRFVAPGDAVSLAAGIAGHVADWDRVREEAVRDAAAVRERHDPTRFRSHVTDVLTSANRTRAAHGRYETDTAKTSMHTVVGDAPVLVVSPHLDDAVLSAYSLLDLGRPVHVLTVLDGAPDPVRATGWDRLCGFADSTAAMGARRRENTAALAALPHPELSLGLLDSQYLDGPRPSRDAAALVEAVRQWMAAHPGPVVVAVPAGAGRPAGATHRVRTTVDSGIDPAPHDGHRAPSSRRARREAIRRAVGPLGRALLDVRATLVARHTRPFCHDDHVWVRDTVLDAVLSDFHDSHKPATVLLYEDLPYLWGKQADDAVAALSATRTPEQCAVGGPTSVPVDRVDKARRVGAYASQLRHMHAPHGRLDTVEGLPADERYWTVTAR